MLAHPAREKLLERAKGAATDVSLLTSAVRARFINAYPHITQAPHWDRFMDYGIVSGCFMLAVALHSYVSEDLRTELELLIQDGLHQYNPETATLYRELHNFFLNKFLPLSREQRSQQTFLIPATWVIISITDWQKIDWGDTMISELEQLFCREANDYWTVEDVSRN